MFGRPTDFTVKGRLQTLWISLQGENSRLEVYVSNTIAVMARRELESNQERKEEMISVCGWLNVPATC